MWNQTHWRWSWQWQLRTRTSRLQKHMDTVSLGELSISVRGGTFVGTAGQKYLNNAVVYSTRCFSLLLPCDWLMTSTDLRLVPGRFGERFDIFIIFSPNVILCQIFWPYSMVVQIPNILYSCTVKLIPLNLKHVYFKCWFVCSYCSTLNKAHTKYILITSCSKCNITGPPFSILFILCMSIWYIK